MDNKKVAEQLKTAATKLFKAKERIDILSNQLKEASDSNSKLTETYNSEKEKRIHAEKELSAYKQAQILIDEDIIDPYKRDYWIGEMLKTAEEPKEYAEKIKALKTDSDSPGEEVKEEDTAEDKKKDIPKRANSREAVAEYIVKKRQNK